ncbi:MAG: hypothetical protein NUV58_03525 [Candidatus Roizmanbacteria bacterium]|nr:hypothetical protein [Candidatus Roizmanbacteria bacterium]
MTKLKIDIKTGVLEVEGEEAFVKEIYQDYKDRLVSVEDFSSSEQVQDTQDDDVELQNYEQPKKGRKTTKKKNIKAKGGNKRKESYNLVTNLDLLAKGNQKALKDFYAEKAPSNAMEKNAVFVYYLQKEAKVPAITVNHVYTCYKHVNVPVPKAFRQSLADTSSKKGWIDTRSMEGITIPTLGENFVEHELGKKKKDDK